MKKVFLVLLMLLLLVSFTNYNLDDKNDNVIVTDDGIMLLNENFDNFYDIENSSFYELVDNDAILYRIVLADSVYLVIENLFDSYFIYGYDNQKNLIKDMLTKQEFSILQALCHSNCITRNDDLWNELFLIEKKYKKISYEVRQKTQVMPYSFETLGPSTYELEKATSTDEYLNGYEYPKYIDTTVPFTDDLIVKIIPKEYFFKEGTHSYCGKEYMFYVETYLKDTYPIPIYESDVLVIDYDFTVPANTPQGITTGEHSNLVLGATECVYIKPIINCKYIGIPDVGKYNAISSTNKFDTSQSKIVVHGFNFYTGYVENPTVYIDISNFIISKEYHVKKDTYVSNVKFDIDTEEYKIEMKGDLTTSLRSFVFFSIFEVLSLIPGVSDFIDILDFCYNIVDISTDLFGKIDDRNIVKENVVSEYLSYDFSLKDSPNFLNFSFPKTSEILQNRNILNYELQIEVNNNNYSSNKNECRYDREIGLNLELIDCEGNKLKIGNKDYYSVTNSINNLVYEDEGLKVINYLNGSFNFTIQENISIGHSLYQLPSDTVICLSVPNNINLQVFDYYGKEIYSNISKYGRQNEMLITLKAQNQYIFTVTTLDGSAGNIKINYISNFININNSYTLSNNFKSGFFKLEHNNLYSILHLYTASSYDTEIFVYNNNSHLVGYDNDSLYNPDEDPGDYNASLHQPFNGKRNYYLYIKILEDENKNCKLCIDYVNGKR